jgi:NADPH-dependent curcumin reductase CurA
MTAPVNRQVVLAARPDGMPKPSDFRIVETPIPQPGPGELLVRACYLSADPLQRVRMHASSTYGNTIPLGQVVWGRMVGEVVESRNAAYRRGEFVEGMLGWQTYAISDGSTGRAEYAPGISRVDPSLAPISTSLGVLGMPGATAYFALLELGRPRPGETVVISAAAGMVGSLAGQIARIMGCRVIGLAGSDAKIAYLTDELGFDAAINYRTAPDLLEAVRDACPGGIDVYFDNVGGTVRDTMLRHLRRGARIPLVGRISGMNDTAPRLCPDPQVLLMHARASMHGFIVYDWQHRLGECRQVIAGWLKTGRIVYRESIVDGLEQAPNAFIALFTGENIGKQLIRIPPA